MFEHSSRLNKEILFHIAYVHLNYLLTTKKDPQGTYNNYFNTTTANLSEEIWRVCIIAKISGYINQPQTFNLNDKLIARFEESDKKVDIFQALLS